MVVNITTAGLSVPLGTTIVSITNNTAVLSNNVTGASGTATFEAVGPSDTSADGGGIVLRGTTNKTITWTDATDAWTISENVDIANTKQYRIGNVLIASNSQIGPSTGSFSLGAGVTASSLTSVGTLTSLTVQGTFTAANGVIANGVINANSGISLGDNDKVQFGASNDLEIYHDGNNTYIDEIGAGDLYIRSNKIRLQSGTSENLAVFTPDNSVELYYDNVKKFETTNAGATVTGDLTVSSTTNLNQITETVANAFNTSLTPSTGTLTVDTSVGTVVLGDLSASVTTWAFTNVPTTNSKATTITLIIDGDTAQTYGDACSVNGSAVSNGVKWSGGSAPTATNNFDIITFTIVKDSAGTINVFGSGNTDFS